MIRRILALVRARNLEFFRDRASLIWNILFPLSVILAFGFGFGGGNRSVFKVAVLSRELAPKDFAFLETKYVSFVNSTNKINVVSKLSRHQFDLVLEFGGREIRYWVNESSPKGYLLEKILLGSQSDSTKLTSDTEPDHEYVSSQKITAKTRSNDNLESSARFQIQKDPGPVNTAELRETTPPSLRASPFLPIKREVISGREIRYVDWLVAGMLGMNLMFSSLFGVGYSIVRYRKNGVLKRLKATPVTSFEFLSAQIISRLFVIFTVSSLIFFGAKFFIHFQMMGSYALLALTILVGALCLISLGLLIVSALRSEELAGGMLQLFSWPMMFLSGVWFSLEGFSPSIKKIAYVFPLTHLIDAARGIITEGHPFSMVAPHLIVLAGLAALFLLGSSLFFRWE